MGRDEVQQSELGFLGCNPLDAVPGRRMAGRCMCIWRPGGVCSPTTRDLPHPLLPSCQARIAGSTPCSVPRLPSVLSTRSEELRGDGEAHGEVGEDKAGAPSRSLAASWVVEVDGGGGDFAGRENSRDGHFCKGNVLSSLIYGLESAGAAPWGGCIHGFLGEKADSSMVG